MVYVDPNEMGWKPFVQSWMNRNVTEKVEVKQYLLQLFDKYVDGGFAYVKKNCQEMMPQSVMGKISMMCSILQAILKKKTFDYELETPKLMQLTAQVFLFAYIWSIGSNLHDQFQQPFDFFVRNQFAEEEYCKLVK
jgi:dynein heavy chain